MNYEYDSWNRIQTINYPDSFVVDRLIGRKNVEKKLRIAWESSHSFHLPK